MPEPPGSTWKRPSTHDLAKSTGGYLSWRFAVRIVPWRRRIEPLHQRMVSQGRGGWTKHNSAKNPAASSARTSLLALHLAGRHCGPWHDRTLRHADKSRFCFAMAYRVRAALSGARPGLAHQHWDARKNPPNH